MKTTTKDGGDETNDSNEKNGRRKCRLWGRVATIGALLFVLGIGGTTYYLQRFWKPIDVENATTSELVGWLTLRDLSAESPETRDQLFDKYFDAISTSDGNATTKIELPAQIKRFTGVFFAGRDEKIADWNAARTRPPYWRVDYVVVPQTPRTSEFILSSDVRPGPALRERWEKRRADAKNKKKSILAVEKNVKLLVMQWFVAQYKAFDATPDAQKKEKIDQSASELLRWQDFYNGLRADAKLPPASRSDLLKEFEASIEEWNEFASPEEIAKILWFKDLLESVLAARENAISKIAQDFGEPQTNHDRATKTDASDSVAVSPYPPRVANAETRLKANADAKTPRIGSSLVDAVRRFVFIEEKAN